MAIPAEILAIERPKNTIVIRTNKTEPAHYAVRSRLGCIYDHGRRIPKNGPVIGHIDTERKVYVPLSEIDENTGSQNNLENSLLLYNDNNMNIIFVLIVIKNFIKSELLNNLLILSLFEYIYKVSFDFDKIKITLINNKDDNNKQL